MKEQKPRGKKVRKEPRQRKKLSFLPQITVPWGRAASEYRPGLFTKQYFEKHGEASCAGVFCALKEELRRINENRVEIGDKAIRGCTYNSFAKYWHWFKLLRLIEPVDRREPAIYVFLEQKQFYRLTDKGKAEVSDWEDPVRSAHPEFD